jgi:hypothetical protein
MSSSVNPPDYTTDIGLVRLLIPDTAVDEEGEFLFTDDQIDGLLGLYANNIKRTAAQAKDIIATDQVLLLKVVRTDDLSVDGAKVAAELRLQAKSLRDQADAADALAVGDYFDIVYPNYPVALPGQVSWPEH